MGQGGWWKGKRLDVRYCAPLVTQWWRQMCTGQDRKSFFGTLSPPIGLWFKRKLQPCQYVEKISYYGNYGWLNRLHIFHFKCLESRVFDSGWEISHLFTVLWETRKWVWTSHFL